MSLINKMLQDLDARGTPKDGALPGQVKPVAPAGFGAGRRTVAAAVAGALAALALGALGWKMLPHGAAPAPAVSAPAVAAAPGGHSVPVATGPAYPANGPAVPAAPAPANVAAGAVQPAATTIPAPAPAQSVADPDAGKATDRQPPRDAVRADDAAAPPPTRAERRAERKRLAAERKEEEAAARRAGRVQDVAPLEPDSAEARAARRAMAQVIAGRGTSPKKRPADVPAAAHDEPAPKARHAAPGRQETGAQRAEGEYRRALASLQDGRTTDTIAALERALKYDPAHEAARQTLVGVLVEAGRTDEAMRQLQLGLTLDARQPAMAMLLARLQIERGASGIETLTRTLPYAGSDPDYHAFLAAALARQGRHREAAEQYVQAVRSAPGNGVWWMGLGISLQAEKRGAEALEAFQKARATGALSPELQGFVERRIQQLGR